MGASCWENCAVAARGPAAAGSAKAPASRAPGAIDDADDHDAGEDRVHQRSALEKGADRRGHVAGVVTLSGRRGEQGAGEQGRSSSRAPSRGCTDVKSTLEIHPTPPACLAARRLAPPVASSKPDVSDLVLRVSSVRRATPALAHRPPRARGSAIRLSRRASLPASGLPGSSSRSPIRWPRRRTRRARGGHRVPDQTGSRRRGGATTSAAAPRARGSRCAGRPDSFVFPEHPRERRFLFIAGGTGIAPLRAMIRHAVLSGRPGATAAPLQRACARDFAYLAELRGMARRGEVALALAATREMPPRWRGERGRIAPAQLAPPARRCGDVVFRLRPRRRWWRTCRRCSPRWASIRSRIRLEDW